MILSEDNLWLYVVLIVVLALVAVILSTKYRSNQRLAAFIRGRGFRLATDFAKKKNYIGLKWRRHEHYISGKMTADIEATRKGLSVYSSTKPEPENSGLFSFNHIGLNLKPVKNRTGIAVDVDVNSIGVRACPDNSEPNLARFVTGAVFFSNGPKRENDNWYNAIFVATGIGMMVGEDKPFEGLGAFAVILHCKDTCLVLEEFSPHGKEAAEVILLRSFGPVEVGDTSTIGIEFIEEERKVIFYRDNDVYEHNFDMDMQITDFNPFLKFDVANFAAPCDSEDALAEISATVKKVYIKSQGRVT